MRVDQADEFAVDLAEQNHAHDFHHLWGGYPETSEELALETHAFKHAGNLRPSPMHYHGLCPNGAQKNHVCSEGCFEVFIDHGVAAVLNDDDFVAQVLQPR